jgi:tetratricopeptide (TPR) repeat protein
MLESRVFSQAGSNKISDKFTAVRMLGGNDMSDEGRAFAKRYGLRGFPSLYAMTADGAVLTQSFQRDLDGILAGMEGAVKTDAEFRAKEQELGKSKLPEALRTMAGLYKDRMQWDQARANFEALCVSNPQVDDQIGLLEVLTAAGDADARKALLGTLIETRKDHEKHIDWRIALATADINTSPQSREEFQAMLEAQKAAYKGLLGELTKPANQAVVRNRLADVLFRTRDLNGATEHWDWILANAKDSPAVPDALFGKGVAAVNQGYGTQDVVKVKEGKALIQKLIDEHGSHAKAGQARRVMAQIDMLIGQLEAAAAKPAPETPGDGK